MRPASAEPEQEPCAAASGAALPRAPARRGAQGGRPEQLAAAAARARLPDVAGPVRATRPLRCRRDARDRAFCATGPSGRFHAARLRAAPCAACRCPAGRLGLLAHGARRAAHACLCLLAPAVRTPLACRAAACRAVMAARPARQAVLRARASFLARRDPAHDTRKCRPVCQHHGVHARRLGHGKAWRAAQPSRRAGACARPFGRAPAACRLGRHLAAEPRRRSPEPCRGGLLSPLAGGNAHAPRRAGAGRACAGNACRRDRPPSGRALFRGAVLAAGLAAGRRTRAHPPGAGPRSHHPRLRPPAGQRAGPWAARAAGCKRGGWLGRVRRGAAAAAGAGRPDGARRPWPRATRTGLARPGFGPSWAGWIAAPS